MTTSEPQKTTRSADHGPLKWTKGTEDRLADFVEKNAKKNDPADIVRVIDEFCWNEHWYERAMLFFVLLILFFCM